MTDPGAAAERTRLAWRRTALSATVVALLAARPAVTPGAGVPAMLLAAASMAVWATVIGLAYRRTAALRTGPPRPGGRTLAGYAALTVIFAVIGGLVVTL